MRGGRGSLRAGAGELYVVGGGRDWEGRGIWKPGWVRAESWVPRAGRFYVCTRGREKLSS